MKNYTGKVQNHKMTLLGIKVGTMIFFPSYFPDLFKRHDVAYKERSKLQTHNHVEIWLIFYINVSYASKKQRKAICGGDWQGNSRTKFKK